MKRVHSGVFRQSDWDVADMYDRMYMHLVEPLRWDLTEHEALELQKLTSVWRIMMRKTAPRDRIKLIAATVECSDRTAHRLMERANRLFGETLRIDHEMELSIAYHKFMRLHDKAIKHGDFDAARRSLDSAMKVRSEIEARQPKAKKVYAQLIFTDDPGALAPGEAEELDYEEIEEGVLELEAIGVPSGD